MTDPTAIGLLVAAGVIGLTHGLEPDHVAGISVLANGADSSRLSAVTGACFALGHVALVAVWLVAATWVFQVSSFPPVLETVGLVVVGVALVGLSLVLGVSSARRLVHRHEHHHDDGVHAHLHHHVPGTREPDHGGHEHGHTVAGYLKVGTVGALFTLSPPLSMIVFVTVVVEPAASRLMVPVVAVYGLAITLTMSLVGFGSGTLFRLARERRPRVHAALQLAVAAMVLAVAVAILAEHLPVAVGW